MPLLAMPSYGVDNCIIESRGTCTKSGEKYFILVIWVKFLVKIGVAFSF
jgi:hypothetical protein